MATRKQNPKSAMLMLLADSVEQFEGEAHSYSSGPHRDLEIEIALSQPEYFELPPRYEGAGRNIAKGDPEGEHTTGGTGGDMMVLHYLSDTDHARQLQPKGWHASTIMQDRWNPALWFVCLRKAGIDGAASCKTNTLAKAWVVAALRAQAMEIG